RELFRSGVIGDKAYFEKKKEYEEFPIHIKEPTDSEIRINYYSSNTKDLLKDDLNAFKKRLGYDGDFEKIEKGNQTIYYAHYENDVYRTYAWYILNVIVNLEFGRTLS